MTWLLPQGNRFATALHRIYAHLRADTADGEPGMTAMEAAANLYAIGMELDQVADAARAYGDLPKKEGK